MVAPDAWREAKRLLTTGVGITACLWVTPVVTLVGLAVLGKAGDDAGAALAVLLVAFALDAFVVIVYQISLESGMRGGRRDRGCARTPGDGALGMVLRDHGALAPALGQLVARVVGAAGDAADRRRMRGTGSTGSPGRRTIPVTAPLVTAVEAESI